MTLMLLILLVLSIRLSTRSASIISAAMPSPVPHPPFPPHPLPCPVAARDFTCRIIAARVLHTPCHVYNLSLGIQGVDHGHHTCVDVGI